MPLDKSSTRVQQMFGEIAGRYDLLNRLLSLGIDRSWRRRTVKLVSPDGPAPILDVCTGTADLALAYWRASKGKVALVGTDFCQPMLAIGREKCRQAVDRAKRHGHAGSHAPRGNGEAETRCLSQQPMRSVGTTVPTQSVGTRETGACGITLLEADTLNLPFADNTFQIVSVAFGLRNLSDTDAGLREMTRVCRRGGRVAILEFSTPTVWPLGRIYGWYFQHVLPRLGQALARNTQAAYNYLPQSVGQFAQGKALIERMNAAGLKDVWVKRFTFGVATLYVGWKK
jgi:demethylmenaquinone methyltransferase / 2-methoxy-6-polyprenyl-1,4-benzoquinol methylase